MAYMEDRALNRIVMEVCKEENIKLDSISYKWIHRLEKNNKIRYIVGYNFDLNLTNVNKIASDKAATYEVLKKAGIPIIPHILFLKPGYFYLVDDDSVYERIMQLGESYGYKVVCKKNDGGFGGNNVYKAYTKFQLESIVTKLFERTNSIALCPLVEEADEYRSIVIDGKIKLMYLKNRQSVTGDGESTLMQLICHKYGDEELKSILLGLDEEASKLINEVIEEDRIIVLNWKHNLGQGAIPQIIDLNNEIYKRIEDIVTRVSREMNIRFASVDIMNVKGELTVLEVNSGVMMQKFVDNLDNGYDIAKAIYKEAILKMFE